MYPHSYLNHSFVFRNVGLWTGEYLYARKLLQRFPPAFVRKLNVIGKSFVDVRSANAKHFTKERCNMQSIFLIARLAQSAERKALNLVVVGSSPTVGVLWLPKSVLPICVKFDCDKGI